VESSPTPLDQPFAQATLPPQTTLEAGHPAVISLVIIAKKMQQPMQSEDAQLDMQRMPGLARLTAGNSTGNHDFAEKPGLLSREGQHVSSNVFAAISAVELADAPVRHDCYGHHTPRPFRCCRLQPACETGCAKAALAHDLDIETRRRPGRHRFGRTIGRWWRA
jgi:hypothetical protein